MLLSLQMVIYLSDENSERIVRSGLNKLIISVDGVDQETYSVYRINGNLNTVIEGIKKLTEAKRQTQILPEN